MLWGLLQLATASAIVTETMITAWQPATGSSEPGGSDVVLAPHLRGGSSARCACTSQHNVQLRWRCAEPELGSPLRSRSPGGKGPQTPAARELNPASPRAAGSRGCGVSGRCACFFSQLAEVSTPWQSPAVKKGCAKAVLLLGQFWRMLCALTEKQIPTDRSRQHQRSSESCLSRYQRVACSPG